MKFPGCILMIVTFAVLAFFFMYIPDIRRLRIGKVNDKKNTAKDLLLCGIITHIAAKINCVAAAPAPLDLRTLSPASQLFPLLHNYY